MREWTSSHWQQTYFLQKKILVVDDLNTSSSEGLKEMIAPLGVMISIPKGARGNCDSRFVIQPTFLEFLYIGNRNGLDYQPLFGIEPALLPGRTKTGIERAAEIEPKI